MLSPPRRTPAVPTGYRTACLPLYEYAAFGLRRHSPFPILTLERPSSMKNTVYDRLARREVSLGPQRYTGIRGIYGDRHWIENLDIVNELEGHSGCVNALRWAPPGMGVAGLY